MNPCVPILSILTLAALLATAAAQEPGSPTSDERVAVAAPVNEVDGVREVAREESRNNARVAQLRRIRAIAQEKGDIATVQRIDDLATRQNRVAERRMGQLRARLGDAEFDRARGEVRRVGATRGQATRTRGANARAPQAQKQSADVKGRRVAPKPVQKWPPTQGPAVRPKPATPGNAGEGGK